MTRTVPGRRLRPRDLSGLYFVCRQTFYNAQVRECLRFLQLDIFMAEGLSELHSKDALFCYERMTKWR